jgi:hypothetical protein
MPCSVCHLPGHNRVTCPDKIKVNLSTTEPVMDAVTRQTGVTVEVAQRPVAEPSRSEHDEYEEDFKEFQKWMRKNKNHRAWKWGQTSAQKHTRTRNTAQNVNESDLGSKGDVPEFSCERTRGSTFQGWIIKDKYYSDYVALRKLGNPLVKESDGGLKWKKHILQRIYNSGEMEGCRKKNNFNPKLKQEIFFPSGKTDTGRTISQFFNRLWFIVNVYPNLNQ